MKEEFVKPFINAVQKVINMEIKMDVEMGNVCLQQPSYTTRDVTIMIGILGKVQGTILYGMDEKTALDLVSEIFGYKFAEFDRIVASGIREMCNIITSMATIEIEKLGYNSIVTPPTLITGTGVRITTFNLERLLIPVETKFGRIDISAVLVDKNLFPERIAI